MQTLSLIYKQIQSKECVLHKFFRQSPFFSTNINRTQIKDVFKNNEIENSEKNPILKISGWIKSMRTGGKNSFVFIDINDGSHYKNLQVMIDKTVNNFSQVLNSNTDDAVECVGELKQLSGKKQTIELSVYNIKEGHYIKLFKLLNEQNEKDRNAMYPISKKFHKKEFLRTVPHFRARTKLYSSLCRIKSDIIFETFNYFKKKNYHYIQTPILTSNDCEGAGELFHVTTLLKRSKYKTEEEKNEEKKDAPSYQMNKQNLNFEDDFFKKECFLNVSSQLSLECLCCSIGDVFTLSPSCRAEMSNSSRHLSEFLMLEIETAFSELTDIIHIVQDYVKHISSFILDNSEDLKYLNENHDTLIKQKLTNLVNRDFVIISYDEAIHLLKEKKKQIENKANLGEHHNITHEEIEWGKDITFKQQKFLTNELFDAPLFVIHYPKEIKPFYMKMNEDEKTVACFDFFLPNIGEVAGGSEREIHLQKLKNRIHQLHMNINSYKPYLELREFGNIPHAGFGLGLDRLIMFLCSLGNIRDVVPFPRYPGHLFM